MPLIGREQDLKQLCTLQGDRLLVGHPGSGKTYLLYHLARQGFGGFVISNDLAEIAASIRTQNPDTIFVDDAHLRLDLLVRLRHFRTETHRDFSIVAVSWPGDRETVEESLALPPSQVHDLQPLTQSEIVDIVHAVGLSGPSQLVAEIVSQSGGQPGLAATLAQICVQGLTKEVVLGEVLSQTVKATFQRLVGRRSTEILAAFAVGGRAGVSIEVVAEYLQLPPIDVREALTKLAAGGVIRQVRWSWDSQPLYAVWPEDLAEVLIRDVYASGFANPPIAPLFDRTSNIRSASKAIVGAALRGGNFERGFLEDVVLRANSSETWESYAALGQNQTRWVLEHRPDLLEVVGHVSIRVDPKWVLPQLFDMAVNDTRSRSQHPTHPIRVIENWIRSAHPSSGQAIRLRSQLLESASSWHSAGGNGEIASCVASIALYPAFEITSMEPGNEMAIRWARGLLTVSELDHVKTMWPRAVRIWQDSVPHGFRHWLDAVSAWLFPARYVVGSVGVQEAAVMKTEARDRLTELALMSRQHPAIQRNISQMAQSAGTSDPAILDEEFMVLFPLPEYGDWEATLARQDDALETLAARWEDKDENYATERLLHFLDDLRLSKDHTIGLVPDFVKKLCERHSNLVGLAQRLMPEADVPSSCLVPLIDALVTDQQVWQTLVKAAADLPFRQYVAVSTVLRHADPSGGQYKLVEALLPQYAPQVEQLCTYDYIGTEMVAALMRHPDSAVSTAASVGEWLSKPTRQIRPALKAEWTTAVLNSTDDASYWLGDILGADETLAHNWLRRRLRREQLPLSVEYSPAFTQAIATLSTEARKCILHAVPATPNSDDIITALVSDSIEIYETLLSIPTLWQVHLAPLGGIPLAHWGEFAALAAKCGFAHEEIAAKAFATPHVIVGAESAYYERFATAFAAFTTHSDPDVRSIADIGQRIAKANQEGALADERDEAVFGIGANAIRID